MKRKMIQFAIFRFAQITHQQQWWQSLRFPTVCFRFTCSATATFVLSSIHRSPFIHSFTTQRPIALTSVSERVWFAIVVAVVVIIDSKMFAFVFDTVINLLSVDCCVCVYMKINVHTLRPYIFCRSSGCLDLRTACLGSFLACSMLTWVCVCVCNAHWLFRRLRCRCLLRRLIQQKREKKKKRTSTGTERDVEENLSRTIESSHSNWTTKIRKDTEYRVCECVNDWMTCTTVPTHDTRKKNREKQPKK